MQNTTIQQFTEFFGDALTGVFTPAHFTPITVPFPVVNTNLVQALTDVIATNDDDSVSEGKDDRSEDGGNVFLPKIHVTRKDDDEEDEKEQESQENEEECPICVSVYNNASREQIVCNDCEFKICKKCFIRNYENPPTEENETTNIFPVCANPDCRKSGFPIYYLEKFRGIRRALYTVTRKRIIENACAREKALLSSSSDIASSYTLRRIFINALNHLRCTYTCKTSRTSIDAVRGKNEFAIPSIIIKNPWNNTKSIPEFISESLFEASEVKPDSTEGLEILGYLCVFVSEINDEVIENPSLMMANLDKSNLCLRGGIAKAVDAKRIWNLRCNAAMSLHRFFVDLPRDWWISTDFKDISEILTEFCKRELFNTKVYDRRMIKVAIENCQAVSHNTTRRGKRKENHTIPCVKEDCRGYMYKNVKKYGDKEILTIECKLCKSFCCYECKVSLDDAGASSHVCDENTVKTIKEIENTTKPCPKCSIPISRTEGCRHMFCVRCNQPYDWETLQPQSSNTNPEYHTWLIKMRERVASGEVGLDDVSAMKNAFNPGARGEDGLTSTERNLLLSNILNQSNMPSLAALVSIASEVDAFIRICVNQIPAPSEYERQRISYLMYDIDEDEWMKRVGCLELTGFFYRNITAVLENFSSETIGRVQRTCVKVDTELGGAFTLEGKREIARTIIDVAKSAAAVNNNVMSSFALGGLPNQKAKSRCIFVCVNSYLKCISEDRVNDVYDSLNTANPTLLYGGRGYGREGDKETSRVIRIFSLVGEKSLNGWINDVIDVSK